MGEGGEKDQQEKKEQKEKSKKGEGNQRTLEVQEWALGRARQAGQGHVLQRGAPWTGLDAGAAHTPLKDGWRKSQRPRSGPVPPQ